MRSAALLILAACSSPAPAPPAAPPPPRAAPVCSTAELDRKLAEYPDIGAELVAAHLVESCPALPEPVRAALRQFAEAGPDLPAAEHVALEHPDVWAHSCRDGARVFTRMPAIYAPDTEHGPRDIARAYWDGCAVESFGIGTLDEWQHGAHLALAILVHGHLAEAGIAPDRVRAYTRALAALDAPRPQTLAQRYPRDTAAPGPRATIATTLDFYLGTKSLADEYADAIAHADLGACGPMPPHAALKLVIADGAAQDGSVVTVEHIGPSSTTENDLRGHEPLKTCLLARAAAIAFPRHAAVTTVVVLMTTK